MKSGIIWIISRIDPIYNYFYEFIRIEEIKNVFFNICNFCYCISYGSESLFYRTVWGKDFSRWDKIFLRIWMVIWIIILWKLMDLN